MRTHESSCESSLLALCPSQRSRVLMVLWSPSQARAMAQGSARVGLKGPGCALRSHLDVPRRSEGLYRMAVRSAGNQGLFVHSLLKRPPHRVMLTCGLSAGSSFCARSSLRSPCLPSSTSCVFLATSRPISENSALTIVEHVSSLIVAPIVARPATAHQGTGGRGLPDAIEAQSG